MCILTHLTSLYVYVFLFWCNFITNQCIPAKEPMLLPRFIFFNFFRRKKGLSLKRSPPQRPFMTRSSSYAVVVLVSGLFQILLYAYLLRLVFLCFRFCPSESCPSVLTISLDRVGISWWLPSHMLLVSLASLWSLLFQKIPTFNFLPKSISALVVRDLVCALGTKCVH